MKAVAQLDGTFTLHVTREELEEIQVLLGSVVGDSSVEFEDWNAIENILHGDDGVTTSDFFESNVARIDEWGHPEIVLTRKNQTWDD